VISAFVDVRLKLFYFNARKLASNYFRGWAQLKNTFQHAQCR